MEQDSFYLNFKKALQFQSIIVNMLCHSGQKLATAGI